MNSDAGFAPLIIIIPLFVFWGFMLRDMAENDDIPSEQRFMWIMGFLFLSFPTAIYYYFTRYRNRD